MGERETPVDIHTTNICSMLKLNRLSFQAVLNNPAM